MATTTLSGILKHMTIFPNASVEGMSAEFEVRNFPVLLRAFNMPCDVFGHLEMAHRVDCASPVWGAASPGCNTIEVSACNNVVPVMIPGYMRIVFRNKAGVPVSLSDDALITATETDLPVEYLAKLGGTAMGCGTDVVPITVAGCLTGLVLDGVTHMLCSGPAPAGATTVQNLGGGVFLATNADGTTATWTIPVVPGVVSPTVVVEAPAGTFTATMPNGSTVSWTIPTAAAPVVLPTLGMTGNPDGSDTVTWTAPDGSTIVFTVQPPVDLAPYMTTVAHAASLIPVYGNDGTTVLFFAHQP